MSRTMTHSRAEFLSRLFDDGSALAAIERARPRCLRDAEARLLAVVWRTTKPRSRERAMLATTLRADARATIRLY